MFKTLSVALLLGVSFLLSVAAQGVDFDLNSQLLMSYVIVKEGAMNGEGYDPFDTPWVQGEIANMGRRQEFLAGTQMNKRYIASTNLVSSLYRAKQTYIRSTNQNDSLESAMALVRGIYPSTNDSVQNYALWTNQTANALPLLNISASDLQAALSTPVSLPYGFPVFSIHAGDSEYDTLVAVDSCPQVGGALDSLESNGDILNYIYVKYQAVIQELAQALGLDPGSFQAIDALGLTEVLYARWFQGYPMGQTYTTDFMNQLMTMREEFEMMVLTKDDTNWKVILTGHFNNMVSRFHNQINKDQGQNVTGLPLQKLQIYMDEEEVLQSLAFVFNTLQFTSQQTTPSFIPYASQVVFDLNRFSSGNYFINASFNGQPVQLPGPCNGSLYCSIDYFAVMAQAYSFYGNQQAYDQICGPSELVQYEQRMAEWQEQYDYAVGIKKRVVLPFMRVLELYAVIMVITLISYCIYYNLKGRDLDRDRAFEEQRRKEHLDQGRPSNEEGNVELT